MSLWLLVSPPKGDFFDFSLVHINKEEIDVSHFLLFITFVHISTRPVFASLSGKEDIASMALSTYSWASARVCSRPELRATISLAYFESILAQFLFFVEILHRSSR